MAHFTYKLSQDTDFESLCQGDILKVTDELRKVLEQYHAYFIDEKYKYFMVITQSCDLVRRKENCKSPYITLAAVRSFDEFLYREMQKDKAYEECKGLKLLDEGKFNKYYQLVERLYNNTEPDYFFLYKDSEFNFNESMVAYLKVSIPIKSDIHYDTCLAAKIMELTDEFKAKLGWSVGYMYSRVGTTDWTNIMSEQDRKEMLKNELASRFVVSNKQKLQQLKKQLEDGTGVFTSIAEAVGFMESIVIKTNYQKSMEIIEEIVNNFPGIETTDKERLFNKIKNNAQLRTVIK